MDKRTDKREKISIIIPYYKESNIDKIAREVKNNIEAEIIFENGILGKGYALKKGSLKATGNIIVWLDADLQIHPIQIRTFLNLMKLYNVKVVIGNKRHKYSIIQYTSFRNIISKTYNWLIRNLFGFELRDTQCGLKIFDAKTLKDILPLINSKGFCFDLEVLIALRENKIMVVDSPVIVNERIGIGSATPKNIIITFFETLKVWYNKKRGRYGIR